MRFFLVVIGPLQILADDLCRIGAPDHAVGGGDHRQRQIEAEHLVDLGGDQRAERREDVGVVTQALLQQLLLIDLVVEQVLVAIVLAEGVVAEQHGVAAEIGHHAVGPVQHRRFDEHQLLAIADVQAVAGLHRDEVPVRLVVMAGDRIDGIGGAVDRCARDVRHQLGQRAGVVLFGMVDDDVIDARQVDLAGQVEDELAAEAMVDGVDQYGLLLADQITVVAGALEGLVFGAVKVTNLPIALTDPVDVFFEQNRHAEDYLAEVDKKACPPSIAGAVPLLKQLIYIDF